MNIVPEEGWDSPALPRFRHWLLAAGGLFVLTLAVPVMAILL